MKEYKPIGTPEANEDSKEELKKLLSNLPPEEQRDRWSGGPDAIEEDAAKYTDLSELNQPGFERNLEILLKLASKTQEWADRLKIFNNISRANAMVAAKILLKEILSYSTNIAPELNNIRSYGRKEEQEELSKIENRIMDIKKAVTAMVVNRTLNDIE
ncbi:MAG: hypothetical protein WCT29_01090 [Candidatus Paceibacterota bacterium]|jgi:hypothetical protein